MIDRRGDAFFGLLNALWALDESDPRHALLPLDAGRLGGFHARLAAYIDAQPRARQGRIDPAAIVQGEVVSMGEGSVIEAGAVVHASCRLVLGANSVVRAGAVLRDDVVVGADCLVGVHCEVVRALVLGPKSYLGHFVYVGDSIIGAGVRVSGNVMMANTLADPGATVVLRHGNARFDTARTHLGALVGDGVTFGASNTLSPGCIVMPGLALPPHVALFGTIDAARRRALMREFSQRWGESPDEGIAG